jgi:Family of unknown function (DUF6325)
MTDDQLELGPIDYIVLEWPTGGPSGEAAPMILDLVKRGTIRVLDVAFLAKGEDGTSVVLDLGAFTEAGGGGFEVLDGASSGLLDDEDLEEAAAALEPGTIAAVLIWENRWIAPIAAALRRSGGQLVDSGRIPAERLIASLDYAEAAR